MTENTIEVLDKNQNSYNHHIFTISIQNHFFEFFSTTNLMKDNQSLFGWLYPKNAIELTIQLYWLISKLSKIKNVRNIVKKINNYCLPIISPQYLELTLKSKNNLDYALLNNQMYPLIHKQNIYKNEFEIYETQHIEYNNSFVK